MKELMRMQQKILKDSILEELGDLAKKAKKGDMTDADFEKVEQYASMNKEGCTRFERILNQLKKIVDEHAKKASQEAKKAIEEERDTTMIVKNLVAVERVSNMITAQHEAMKRKKEKSVDLDDQTDHKKSKSCASNATTIS